MLSTRTHCVCVMCDLVVNCLRLTFTLSVSPARSNSKTVCHKIFTCIIVILPPLPRHLTRACLRLRTTWRMNDTQNEFSSAATTRTTDGGAVRGCARCARVCVCVCFCVAEVKSSASLVLRPWLSLLPEIYGKAVNMCVCACLWVCVCVSACACVIFRIPLPSFLLLFFALVWIMKVANGSSCSTNPPCFPLPPLLLGFFFIFFGAGRHMFLSCCWRKIVFEMANKLLANKQTNKGLSACWWRWLFESCQGVGMGVEVCGRRGEGRKSKC